MDANWNLASSVSDTVGITSSDSTATLPPNAALAGGTQNLLVTFNSTGSFTLTATDASDGTKTASTSPAITVNSPQFTQATGGSAIPADLAASGTFTNLTGPTYTENASGDVGTGTIILNAPAGFIFDTNSPSPSVSSVKFSGAANNVVQGSVTSVTTNQITYTVTAGSSSTQTRLTWQNVRVRPTSGTTLASGNLTITGTANVVGVSTNSNLGVLREVAGGANKLVIRTQPSPTANAGVPFAQQPVIEVQDQFGTLRNSTNGIADNTTVITASRGTGSGTLQGATSLTAANGLVSYTNLAHNVANNITLLFTGASLTSVTSTTIAISATAADRLAFTTSPANATAGSAFGTQPVVRTQDPFGNNSILGLPASLTVNVSLTSGTGLLQGTTALNIGSSTGNGTVTFTDLRIDAAGSKQLTATASGLTNALSSTFTVNPSTVTAMVIQTQPPGSTSAGATFSPAPVVRLEDVFGNLATTDNSTVVTATRNLGSASLQGTTSVTASGGLATFSSLSYNLAETININFSSSGLTTQTSANITVTSAAANKLTILTQPSMTATAGVLFAQQPVVRIEDQFGNLRSSDNSTVVTAARNLGSGTLQGTANLTAVAGLVTYTNLSHNVATTINLNFTASGLSTATSSNIVVSAAAFAKLQLLVPGETAAPGATTGKTGTPTAQTAGTALNVTVNAVDTNWNVVSTITDTVGMTSSDSNAALPSDASLVAGTKTFSVTFKTVGTRTLTASDIDDPTKPASLSPSITVNVGAFAKLQLLVPGEIAAPGTASGKTGTPADQVAGTAFNLTVNAVDANWNLVSSSHTVGITASDPNDTPPSNASLSSGTRTFALTFKTVGSWTVTATDSSDGTKTPNTSPSISANPGAVTKLQILLPGEVAAPGQVKSLRPEQPRARPRPRPLLGQRAPPSSMASWSMRSTPTGTSSPLPPPTSSSPAPTPTR